MPNEHKGPSDIVRDIELANLSERGGVNKYKHIFKASLQSKTIPKYVKFKFDCVKFMTFDLVHNVWLHSSVGRALHHRYSRRPRVRILLKH